MLNSSRFIKMLPCVHDPSHVHIFKDRFIKNVNFTAFFDIMGLIKNAYISNQHIFYHESLNSLDDTDYNHLCMASGVLF